jgi:hypothetical protein
MLPGKHFHHQPLKKKRTLNINRTSPGENRKLCLAFPKNLILFCIWILSLAHLIGLALTTAPFTATCTAEMTTFPARLIRENRSGIAPGMAEGLSTDFASPFGLLNKFTRHARTGKSLR